MNLKFRIQDSILLKTSFRNKKSFTASVGYLQPSGDISVIRFSCLANGVFGIAAVAGKKKEE